jgi:transcription termination/antitermination protein NusG
MICARRFGPRVVFCSVQMCQASEKIQITGSGAARVTRKMAGMAKRWYSVSVLSNFEKKIAEQIKTAVAEANLGDEIDEVLVPTEEVLEVRRGKKVTSERRFMPGYVLVHMEMSSRGYHLISSINRVTGFLGPQGRPMPMRDAEVNQILNRVEEGLEAPRNLIRFEIGENVQVTDGPFEGFAGMVEDVDEAHSRLKVTVSIFGRATPVELEFTQVTKQS